MKNLLKGMLIGFIIGGILLTAAAFLFFRHPTEEPEPEVPAAEVSKAVQEEAPESGISLPEESGNSRKYLPWSRPEKHPKKSPSRKNRAAPSGFCRRCDVFRPLLSLL